MLTREIYPRFSQEGFDQAKIVGASLKTLNNRRLIKEAIAIDPEGTPDADDAFTVNFRGGVYNVAISIADIASFIPPGSPLDNDARKRFRTRYLGSPRNNVPMLPKILSEKLLSLTTYGLKPTITTGFSITRNGEIGDLAIERTLTDVSLAISYQSADIRLTQDFGPVEDTLRLARDISKILAKSRNYKVDELWGIALRSALDKRPKTRDHEYASNKIVQEFNVAHNIILAKFCRDNGIPILYRNHNPKKADVQQENQRVSSAIEQALLDSAEVDEDNLWETAYFSIYPEGHQGLGLSEYAQFSSPIRRYQDLVNQGLLLDYLSGQPICRSIEDLKDIAHYGNSFKK